MTYAFAPPANPTTVSFGEPKGSIKPWRRPPDRVKWLGPAGATLSMEFEGASVDWVNFEPSWQQYAAMRVKYGPPLDAHRQPAPRLSRGHAAISGSGG
jgi:hypothetical protein